MTASSRKMVGRGGVVQFKLTSFGQDMVDTSGLEHPSEPFFGVSTVQRNVGRPGFRTRQYSDGNVRCSREVQAQSATRPDTLSRECVRHPVRLGIELCVGQPTHACDNGGRPRLCSHLVLKEIAYRDRCCALVAAAPFDYRMLPGQLRLPPSTCGADWVLQPPPPRSS